MPGGKTNGERMLEAAVRQHRFNQTLKVLAVAALIAIAVALWLR